MVWSEKLNYLVFPNFGLKSYDRDWGSQKTNYFIVTRPEEENALLFHNAVKICSMAVAKAAELAMATKW